MYTLRLRTACLCAGLAVAVAALACGGGSGTTTPTPVATPAPAPSPTPTPAPTPTPTADPATITITAAGVSPSTVTVAIGGRVTFVNNDSRAHDMSSDPHPDHSDCPEVTVGFMNPGQSRTTQNLTRARTCGFHDHNQPTVASLRGSIRIQ